jgi:parallel beta-helix repeat protein
MALEEGVGHDLVNVQTNMPRATLRARLVKRLVDNLAMSEEAADWAVNSWGLALGVVSEEELKFSDVQELEKTRLNVSPPENHNSPQIQNQQKPQSPAAAGGVFIVSANNDGHFISLAEAIKTAKNGEKILVRPGLYEESLVINKQIEIVGDGAVKEIVIRSRDSSCVNLQDDRAIVRNLTLQCSAGQAGREVFGVDVAGGEMVLENCAITSDSLACIGVRGKTAKVEVSKCLIYDGADSGIYFLDSASGKIEGCEIYQNNRAGVVITQNANPTFRKCRIFNGGNAGFLVYQNGLGTIDDCEIFGHKDVGVAVASGGSPVLRGCSIYNSNNSGVNVRDGGRALLEDCSIYENAGAGLTVDGASVAAVQSSRINRNGKVAVRVKGGSSVRVENSDLRGNLLATWETEHGVFVENNNNLEF